MMNIGVQNGNDKIRKGQYMGGWISMERVNNAVLSCGRACIYEQTCRRKLIGFKPRRLP